MRIVVVGGSGNVGTAVLEALPGHDLVGVSRRPPADAAPYDQAEWHTIDISDPLATDRLVAAFDGADAVVHAAWLIQPSRDEPVRRATNVDGSRRVFDAAGRAGVDHVVHLSSVGAYSPGPAPKNVTTERVTEDWPTDGVPSSSYSRHKAAVERELDGFETRHPGLTVTRLRPGLILQRGAASEIQRYFIGSLVPAPLFGLARAAKVPVLPLPSGLVLQFTHASDVADAVRRAIERRFHGPVNLAAEPVLGPADLARLVGARHVPIPAAVLRAATSASSFLRLQPTTPGWIDLALAAPLLDTTVAREQLGWTPSTVADEAVRELLAGLADGSGRPSPALRPRNHTDQEARP